jgi:hypothetical protein
MAGSEIARIRETIAREYMAAKWGANRVRTGGSEARVYFGSHGADRGRSQGA